jgi:hypothetical protein
VNMKSWIKKNMEEHGRAWINSNLRQAEIELGKTINSESYMATVRIVAREMRERSRTPLETDYEKQREPGDPVTFEEILNPSDLADYAKLDLTKFKITGGRIGKWGNSDNPNKYTRINIEPITPDESALQHDMERVVQELQSPIPWKLPKVKRNTENDTLLEIMIPDLHLGKVSDAEEVGEAYNLEIAFDRYIEAILRFADYAQLHKPEKIALITGGDFFNVDSLFKTTTNGTPQDEQGTWMQTFTRGRRLLIQAIAHLYLIAPVEVKIIRGNHDSQRSWYLGEVLAAWFRDTDEITIDNSRPLRKYLPWGVNLLMHTHGHGVKLEQLPLLMAQEVPELWAKSYNREVKVGHFHHSAIKSFTMGQEIGGVRLFIHSSLAGLDSWHTEKGYHSHKNAEATLYSKSRGRLGTCTYEPIPEAIKSRTEV